MRFRGRTIDLVVDGVAAVVAILTFVAALASEDLLMNWIGFLLVAIVVIGLFALAFTGKR